MKKSDVKETDDILFWGITWLVLLVVCLLICAGAGLAWFGFFVWAGIAFIWAMFLPDRVIDKQKARILRIFGR